MLFSSGYEEKYGSKFNALSELKAKREEKERKEKMREEKQKKKSRKKESESESGSDYEKLGLISKLFKFFFPCRLETIEVRDLIPMCLNF